MRKVLGAVDIAATWLPALLKQQHVLTLLLLVLVFRRYLYDMTSKWLRGGSNYKVDRVYVWNAGEHD
jgi:hypothetical protein